MKAKLVFASVFTLGILASFIFCILFAIAYAGGMINATLMIGGTILVNFVLWLVSPWITDLVQGWVYKVEKIEFQEFQRRFPQCAQFLQQVCGKYGIKVPMLRIIHDNNPTAFCYGSYPGNARLVISDGIFHYLNSDEAVSVIAHEVGHIVNKDFIVMTIAATLLQILYELYVVCRRIKTKKNNPFPAIALAAYILWWIGQYILLYLSRTREYMADRFSAEETREPNNLSSALVKIAYGIAEQPDTANSSRLMASTRAMGIYDFKAAEASGPSFRHLIGTTTAESKAFCSQCGKPRTPDSSFCVSCGNRFTKEPSTLQDSSKISRIFLFDLYNPWAKVVELSSTHPLTGKRLGKLNEYAKEFGQRPLFNFDVVQLMGSDLDRGKLYGKFFFEVLIYFAPYLGMLAGFLGLFAGAWGAPILGLGAGMMLKGFYRFSPGDAQKTTVLDLMCDPYASPLRGTRVEVEGKIIGRGRAGSKVSEDFMMQDTSGALIYLNYESPIPLLGNLFFGLKKVEGLIGEQGAANGWFRRGIGQILDLNTLNLPNNSINSYTRFWGVFGGALVAVIGIIVTVVSLIA